MNPSNPPKKIPTVRSNSPSCLFETRLVNTGIIYETTFEHRNYYVGIRNFGSFVPLAAMKTRAQRKVEDKTEPPPKKRNITLGQHLLEEREEEAENILKLEAINKYEIFSNYKKPDVLSSLGATEMEGMKGTRYTCPNHNDTKIVFLSLETGPNPSQFTHICNNSCLIWNLKSLCLPEAPTGVQMVFVRGEHVEGCTKDGEDYKYLGLVGTLSALRMVRSTRRSPSFSIL